MRTKITWLAVAASLLLLVSVLAAGCGGDDGGGDGGGEASRTPGNPIDRAFVADMVPHHESAVEMAEIARERGDSDFVRNLAGGIIETQNTEIVTMREVDGELEAAGVVPGDLGIPEHEAGMTEDIDALRDADPFDREFIDMMVPHHQGAIRMARVELERGANPELRELAQEIIDGQAREIEEMNEHREEEFGRPSPAGGVPEEAEQPEAEESEDEEHHGG
jgi:uncharacterized protein (DUF305 family)